jgi:hypothetical protein
MVEQAAFSRPEQQSDKSHAGDAAIVSSGADLSRSGANADYNSMKSRTGSTADNYLPQGFLIDGVQSSKPGERSGAQGQERTEPGEQPVRAGEQRGQSGEQPAKPPEGTSKNPDGSTINEHYDKDGNRTETKYDKDGKETEQTKYGKDGKPNEQEKFDHDGKKVEQTAWDKDGNKVCQHFDKDGKRTEEDKFGKDGKITEQTKYDSDGKRIEQTSWGTDGSKTCEKFDKDGKRSEEDKFGKDGKITEQTKYDGDGKKTEHTTWANDGSKTCDKFDKDGKQVEQDKWGSDNRPTEQTRWDKDGKPTEVKFKDGNPASVTRNGETKDLPNGSNDFSWDDQGHPTYKNAAGVKVTLGDGKNGLDPSKYESNSFSMEKHDDGKWYYHQNGSETYVEITTPEVDDNGVGDVHAKEKSPFGFLSNNGREHTLDGTGQRTGTAPGTHVAVDTLGTGFGIALGAAVPVADLTLVPEAIGGAAGLAGAEWVNAQIDNGLVSVPGAPSKSS